MSTIHSYEHTVGGVGRSHESIPVSVILSRIRAVPGPDGVEVTWQPAEGESHFGFELFRSSASGAERGWTRVNGEPVRMDGRWRMHDGAAPDGARVNYRLVSIDFQGFRAIVGEVTIVVDLHPSGSMLDQLDLMSGRDQSRYNHLVNNSI